MSLPKTRRLTAKLRKDSIAESALPLFARKGLDGVTTNELAETCGVSEALIFQHFPSKVALFNDMLQRYADFIEPTTGQIYRKPLCTSTLIELVFNFIDRVVVKESDRGYQVMRLFYRSFVDDGEFASQFLQSKLLRVLRKCFNENLSEARLRGDALPLATSPTNLFWFVQHVASMACLIRLPPRRAVRYAGSFAAAVDDMVLFALRGIGVTDAALKQHATAAHFAEWRKNPTL